MYRFALTRHCGLDPQSAEHYEIPRQARNDENHKIYTLLPTPILSLILLLMAEKQGNQVGFVGSLAAKGFFKNKDFSNKPILN